MPRIDWLTAFAAALGLGLMACNSADLGIRRLAAKAEDRKTAPDFALKDGDGHTVHLSDYRGKVVLLDFWATNCGPCLVEIPYFSEFERTRRDKGFAVLGLSMDEGWGDVRPFIKEFKVNYRVLLSDEKTPDAYGVEATPTTLVIDREGRVYQRHVGLTPKKDFENEIDKLLEDGRAPSEKVRADGGVRSDAAGASAQAHGF